MQLEHVEFMPKELDNGILYVSHRFQVAAHLCACGCGEKVVTPLGQTEWKFTERNGRATLYPSIGNWQIPCRSHYWIRNGEVVWSYPWTDEEIEEGYSRDNDRREKYFEKKVERRTKSIFKIIYDWFFPPKI